MQQLIEIGIEIVTCDWEGRVLVTMRMNRNFFLEPLVAKTFGTRQATIVGVELSLRNIMLKGDSLQIIQVIKKVEDSWTRIGMLINDIRHKLLGFDHWTWFMF